MGAFSLNISKFCQKAKANPRTVTRKVVLDVGTGVVNKTPVGDPSTWKNPAPAGYVGGRARGSWQYAQGGPVTVEPGTVDGSGQASLNRIRAGIAGGDPATTHYITSSVPYIRELEYEPTHSPQAPNGMVRVTIEEWRRYLEKAIKELK